MFHGIGVPVLSSVLPQEGANGLFFPCSRRHTITISKSLTDLLASMTGIRVLAVTAATIFLT